MLLHKGRIQQTISTFLLGTLAQKLQIHRFCIICILLKIFQLL
ncbi:hypothetical protein ACP70R_027883 [Stipagrostis hirtigluma subsp. patula]